VPHPLPEHFSVVDTHGARFPAYLEEGGLVAQPLGKAFNQLIYPALLSVKPAAAPLGLTAWGEVEDLI
jgi:hypothetical protein